MKQTLTKFLLITYIIVCQLGFINAYNNEGNKTEKTITKEKQSNAKLKLTIKKTFLVPILTQNIQNKEIRFIPNYNLYFGYFAPQNFYYLLTGIIKNIN